MQAFGFARIGRDCELRTLNNGDAVTNVSLAFAWGKKGDDGKRAVVWLDGAIYGKRAEALAQYLVKGQGVAVTLEEVHIETYQNRDGAEGHKLVGKITQIELAGGAPQQSSAPAQRQQSAPQRQATQQQRPPARQAAPAGGGFDDFDSDIPFITASPALDFEASMVRRVRRGDCR